MGRHEALENLQEGEAGRKFNLRKKAFIAGEVLLGATALIYGVSTIGALVAKDYEDVEIQAYETLKFFIITLLLWEAYKTTQKPEFQTAFKSKDYKRAAGIALKPYKDTGTAQIAKLKGKFRN